MFTKEIIQPNLDLSSNKIIQRTAVRAIIVKNGQLLILYSQKEHDYSLPGGGLKPNETQCSALKREIAEECGLEICATFKHVAHITEIRKPIETHFDLFKMHSNYYFAHVTSAQLTKVPQNLDPYEKELQLSTHWKTIDEILQHNQTLFNTRSPNLPKWVERETFFFKYLFENKSKYYL